MSTAAKAKGIKGVVIKGGCRDLAEHRELGFPVYANYHTTLGQKSFVRPSLLSVPVDMSPHYYSSPTIVSLYPPSFEYKITVNPGDIIVCDEDGCVAVPPDLIEKVVEKGKEGRDVDENVRKDLEKGKGVKESMAKWRGEEKKGWKEIVTQLTSWQHKLVVIFAQGWKAMRMQLHCLTTVLQIRNRKSMEA